jgi:hypothetical protein
MALTAPPAHARTRAKSQQEHPVLGLQRAIGNQGALRQMRANAQNSLSGSGPKADVTNQPAGGGSGDTIMRQSQPVQTHFKGCKKDQSDLIDAVVQRAKPAVVAASSAVASAYGRPKDLTSARRHLLMDHFHTTDHDHLRIILGNYHSILKAFDSGLDFQCEAQCEKSAKGNVCGYAYNTKFFGGRGPIHLCFDQSGCDFPSRPTDEQTAIVIHEAAHRHAGVDDKRYHHEPEYAKLKPKEAIDNADSYAMFAVKV